MEEPMNYNPSPTTGPETAGQKAAEPQYLTRAEAEALEQDILKKVYSYADKGRARAEKALEEVTKEVNLLTRPIETTAHEAQQWARQKNKTTMNKEIT